MIVCLLLSDFVIALERARQPELAGCPLVVVTPKGKREVVYALSEEAKQVGVTLGMTKSRVGALCPEAVVHPGTPKRYQAVAERICDALLTVTDRIEYEQAAALTIWLDIGTLSQADSQTLLVCAKAILEREVKATLAMGIAKGRSTARIAAATAHAGCIRWIADGQERAFLSPLPLRVFAIPPKLFEKFDGLGLEQLGDLACLPYTAVRTRFGEVGSQLHRLANGHDRLRLNPYQQRERIVHSFCFDTPITEWGMAEALLHDFAARGTKQLREQNLTCGEVVLSLECDNQKRIEVSRTLREPIASEKGFQEEFRRLLTQTTLDSGLVALTVMLDGLTTPKPVQMDFFDTLFGQPGQAATAIVEQLVPRHREAIFSRVVVTSEPSYLLERNVTFEPMVAA